MIREPISKLSDQRYYHVVLLSPRERSFSPRWVWNTLGKDCEVEGGRFSSNDSRAAIQFRTIMESPSFAGSVTSRGLLGRDAPEDLCGYDAFTSKISPHLVAFGTAYRGLTRELVTRLLRWGLLKRAWFVTPKLGKIVDYCRGPGDQAGEVRLSVTGFSAFVPGVKNLSGLRLAGPDVFRSGLIEGIEAWILSRGKAGESDDGGGVAGELGADDDQALLRYQALRLSCMGMLTGTSVSVTLAGDGATKMYVRKGAANVVDFCNAMDLLHQLGRFDRTAEQPSWAEGDEESL